VLHGSSHRHGGNLERAHRRRRAGGVAGSPKPCCNAGFRPRRDARRRPVRPRPQHADPNPSAGYAATCAALRDADLTDAARAVRVPTLCVAGQHDGSTPPELVRTLSGLIAGSQYREIANAGHLPCIERPEELGALILTFSRKTRSRPGRMRKLSILAAWRCDDAPSARSCGCGAGEQDGFRR